MSYVHLVERTDGGVDEVRKPIEVHGRTVIEGAASTGKALRFTRYQD